MNRGWCVSLFVLLIGCARPKPPPPPASATPSFRALGQSLAVEETRNDEAIGLEIWHRLTAEIPGESAGVVVEVSDAVVTLRGAARTQAAAWRIEAIAHAVKGVKQVRNQIVTQATPKLP